VRSDLVAQSVCSVLDSLSPPLLIDLYISLNSPSSDFLLDVSHKSISWSPSITTGVPPIDSILVRCASSL
jgi:hypothetical protein